MNRRESLKTLGIGAATTALLIDASCKTAPTKVAEDNTPPPAATDDANADPSRLPNEIARDKKLEAENSLLTTRWQLSLYFGRYDHSEG